jgi:hypothetical protein
MVGQILKAKICGGNLKLSRTRAGVTPDGRTHASNKASPVYTADGWRVKINLAWQEFA